MMNTVNASTGFSGFQLRMGRSPRIIPPLVHRPAADLPDEEALAAEIIARLDLDVVEAQENLLTAKISQAVQSNKTRADDHDIKVGDRVKLTTVHRRAAYVKKGDKRVAKYTPRFDLGLTARRKLAEPAPILTDGENKWLVRDIIDERVRCKGKQYLVRYEGNLRRTSLPFSLQEGLSLHTPQDALRRCCTMRQFTALLLALVIPVTVSQRESAVSTDAAGDISFTMGTNPDAGITVLPEGLPISPTSSGSPPPSSSLPVTDTDSTSNLPTSSPVATDQTATPAQSNSHRTKARAAVIAGAVVTVVFLAGIVLLVLWMKRRRRLRALQSDSEPYLDEERPTEGVAQRNLATKAWVSAGTGPNSSHPDGTRAGIDSAEDVSANTMEGPQGDTLAQRVRRVEAQLEALLTLGLRESAPPSYRG
ncbi:hypothetical protein C8R47DRAFT_1222110 [Mycena vitilis]|nr:hypothetical protein C8R47DRAFT_1222110 [Mycena vitilis]